MRRLAGPLLLVALSLVWAGSAEAEPGGFSLGGRLSAGGVEYSIRLWLDTDRALHLRGELGAGDRQYDFRFRLGEDGVRLDAGPSPRLDRRSPPPPGLDDV